MPPQDFFARLLKVTEGSGGGFFFFFFDSDSLFIHLRANSDFAMFSRSRSKVLYNYSVVARTVLTAEKIPETALLQLIVQHILRHKLKHANTQLKLCLFK